MEPDPTNPPATLKPPRWRRWLVEGLLLLGIAIAINVAVQLWQGRATPRGPAPQFAGQRLDGTPFDLAAWRAQHPGRAVLLYFWADWCAICQTTAGNVTVLAKDWPVTSIAIQSGPAGQVARIMAEAGYNWPTLPDPKAAIHRQYGLPGVPAFIVINPAGEVAFVTLGYTSELALRLRLWWASRVAR